MLHEIILSSSQCSIMKAEKEKMKDVPYASTVGSIMYSMNCSRPDLVCVRSRVVNELNVRRTVRKPFGGTFIYLINE